MLTVYEGRIQNGQIQLEGSQPLPEGMRVVVVIIGDGQTDDTRAEGVTGADLLAADFIGQWAGREDIGDTAEFAERLRHRAERRD